MTVIDSHHARHPAKGAKRLKHRANAGFFALCTSDSHQKSQVTNYFIQYCISVHVYVQAPQKTTVQKGLTDSKSAFR